MARPPQGNYPDRLASKCINDGHASAVEQSDRQESFFIAVIDRGHLNMRVLEDQAGVYKIETLFIKIVIFLWTLLFLLTGRL
jgi:hypothetical protein